MNQIFSDSNGKVKFKHIYPFLCPEYVLDKDLQSSTQIFHKWKRRATVGIYLGNSNHHARQVSLILNISTGLVSPQYYKVDPTFDTIDKSMEKYEWKRICGFMTTVSRNINREPVEKMNFMHEKGQPEQ